MKRLLVVVTALVVCTLSPLSAVDGDKAMYIGGTISGIKDKAEGSFLTKSETAIRFSTKNEGAIEIPYANITSLEYGQKAGRRIGVAIMVSPLALFSKKRNHFLTVSFSDAAGKEQSAVFELGKDIVRTTLTVVETRSGKQIEYQDEEARKHSKGGN
jgi:hypothetical protein